MLIFPPAVCGTANTSQQFPDPPTADQLQCITDASTAQALDIVSDCDGVDLSDVRIASYLYVHYYDPFFCSCQVSATTVRLASTAFQAFTTVAAIMHLVLVSACIVLL